MPARVFLMKRSNGLVKNIHILGMSKFVTNEIEKNDAFLPVNKRKNLIIIENDYFRWGNDHEKSLIVIICLDDRVCTFCVQPIKRCV